MWPRQIVARRSGVVQRVLILAGLVGFLIIGVVDRAQAQRLGRLFSTSEERLQLDEARREYAFGDPGPEQPQTEVEKQEEKKPRFSQFTINGVVKRSGAMAFT